MAPFLGLRSLMENQDLMASVATNTATVESDGIHVSTACHHRAHTSNLNLLVSSEATDCCFFVVLHLDCFRLARRRGYVLKIHQYLLVVEAKQAFQQVLSTCLVAAQRVGRFALAPPASHGLKNYYVDPLAAEAKQALQSSWTNLAHSDKESLAMVLDGTYFSKARV